VRIIVVPALVVLSTNTGIGMYRIVLVLHFVLPVQDCTCLLMRAVQLAGWVDVLSYYAMVHGTV